MGSDNEYEHQSEWQNSPKPNAPKITFSEFIAIIEQEIVNKQKHKFNERT